VRKGLLITGAALIIAAVAVFLLGIYLSTDIVRNITLIITEVPYSAELRPEASIPITNVSEGVAVLVIYNDTLGRPLQVVTPGSGMFVEQLVNDKYAILYVPEVSSGTLWLRNNYSVDVMVYYTYGAVNIGSLTPLALSTLVTLGLGIAGVVLLILGALLRSID